MTDPTHVGPKTSLSSFGKVPLVTARLSQHLPNSFADILIVTPQLQSQIQSAFLNAHSAAGSCAVTAMSVFSRRSQTPRRWPREAKHNKHMSTSSESAPNLATPVHQLLSYCPSDTPSLISPVSTELGVNPAVCKELGHSAAKAVTPTSVRLLLTSFTNLLILTSHL
jgi:hypothetical protein